MAIPVLVVELTVVAALILRSLNRSLSSLKQSRRSVLILFAIWIVSAGYSNLAATANPPAAYYHFGLTLFHVLMAWLIKSDFDQSPEFAKTTLKAIVVGLSVYALIVLAFAATVTNGDLGFWRSLGAGVTNVRHLNNYALILFCLAGAWYVSWPKDAGRNVAAASTVLALFLIYWTGGRGAFLAAHIVLLLLLLLYRDRGSGQLLKLVVISTLLVVPLAQLTAPPSPDYGPLNMFQIVPGSPSSGGDFSAGRNEMWQESLVLISERPWFGYGEAQFRWVAAFAGGHYNHPHNILLQMTFQWGLIGFGLLLFWLFNLMPISQLASAVKNRTQVPALIVIIGLLGISLVDGPLFYHFPAMIFAICLAAFISASRSTTLKQITGKEHV